MSLVTTTFWTKAPKKTTILLKGRRTTHEGLLKWTRSDGIQIVRVHGSSAGDIIAAQEAGSLGFGSSEIVYLAVLKDKLLQEKQFALTDSSMNRILEKVDKIFPGKQIEVDFGDPEVDSLPLYPPGYENRVEHPEPPDVLWTLWWGSLSDSWKSTFTRKFPAIIKRIQKAVVNVYDQN